MISKRHIKEELLTCSLNFVVINRIFNKNRSEIRYVIKNVCKDCNYSNIICRKENESFIFLSIKEGENESQSVNNMLLRPNLKHRSIIVY